MHEAEVKLAVIIEDDADVRNLLKTVLTQSGFQTVLTSNGEDGIEAVRTYRPILTTLDVSMPGMDGFAVAKRIREFSPTYIMMLTALADEIDVVQGLDSGADDYLIKPFRPRELRARIETLLRRPRDRAGITVNEPVGAAPVLAAPEPAFAPAPAPVPAATPLATAVLAPDRPFRRPVHEPAPAMVQSPTLADGWLEHRGLRLNEHTRSTLVDGASVELTRSEFDLLAALMGSGRRVRSKADLVLALRGETYVTAYYVNDADKRAVEVHMANLRRKIGDSSATPRFIETVRGVGYRLASDRDVI